MKGFDDLKKMAADAAGTIADKSIVFAKKAADKTKAAARAAKLSAEIAVERDSIKKNYTEIGKLYYEKYKDNPDEEMAQAISEVSISMAIIESKKSEIEELKKTSPEADEFCCEEDVSGCADGECKCEDDGDSENEENAETEEAQKDAE